MDTITVRGVSYPVDKAIRLGLVPLPVANDPPPEDPVRDPVRVLDEVNDAEDDTAPEGVEDGD